MCIWFNKRLIECLRSVRGVYIPSVKPLNLIIRLQWSPDRLFDGVMIRENSASQTDCNSMLFSTMCNVQCAMCNVQCAMCNAVRLFVMYHRQSLVNHPNATCDSKLHHNSHQIHCTLSQFHTLLVLLSVLLSLIKIIGQFIFVKYINQIILNDSMSMESHCLLMMV